MATMCKHSHTKDKNIWRFKLPCSHRILTQGAFLFPIIPLENSEQMSAIVLSDGTYKPYHGFRHQVFWEILITMNGMMNTQGEKYFWPTGLLNIFSEQPPAESVLIRPPGLSGDVLLKKGEFQLSNASNQTFLSFLVFKL